MAIELRDHDGRIVTNTDRAVTVLVDGAGVLVGYCSANPRTTQRFDATTRRTFDGSPLARPAGFEPTIVIATTNGLPSASVHMEAGPLAVPNPTVPKGI